jgi:hypothetical protein
MSDDTHAMPEGPSRVVLLKLAEYRQPYVLTLKSAVTKGWGRKERVFVPTVIVLDKTTHAWTKIVKAQLDRPLRFTGHLMFDESSALRAWTS